MKRDKHLPMGSGGNPASQWLVQINKANRGSDATMFVEAGIGSNRKYLR
ncbi:hypothetical protein ACQKCU_08875 [Heyndrickxia sporothermodurans]